MKTLLIRIPVIFFTIFLSCTSKPMYKDLGVITHGNSKSTVTEKWGKPDRVLKSVNNNGNKELWIYQCIAYADCDDSPDCRFSAPCYMVLFVNDVVADIHSSQ